VTLKNSKGVDIDYILVYSFGMLEKIFGNKSAEYILLFLYHYGELHASAIAESLQTAITPIKNQLERFEEAGVLISKTLGRSRVYAFNPKSPFVKPVRELLRIAYESIPFHEREKIFSIRRRPRRKGKPL